MTFIYLEASEQPLLICTFIEASLKVFLDSFSVSDLYPLIAYGGLLIAHYIPPMHMWALASVLGGCFVKNPR